ncbi:CAMK family protein kinase [Tritrichomonas foetus]|uniref:CAMK family protein kinase n=1 Tax=Tritrichomonas foetus TaxID=1144522 RepID=A0A1J4JAT0_9EUKA|nr:CAMK family protein kinase [Tritrichomonas foetus]|eukprot:OHS96290.1 CAMK family protein kinase [Tritrichomonas foetus]
MPPKSSSSVETRSPRSPSRPRTSDGSPSSPTQLSGYKFMNELGQGAFATVYKAEEIATKTIYAIKVVSKDNLGTPEDITRFQREIDAMALLKHENVVQLHNFFSDDNNFYLVIDYCPNGELYDFIIKNGKIAENTAALLFQQISSAIAYCHSYGVAHRDLKPQNILIQKFPFVKIADFGLCGYIKEDDLMKTFCGSPAFVSPECLSKQVYDGRKSDIWSLGVILYAMVTGEFPWNLSNTNIMIQQIMKAEYKVPSYISDPCKELITHMLKVNPNDRISIEDILKHPFLKLAATANVVKKNNLTVKPPKLPKLPSASIEQLTKLNSREGHADHGIYSPMASRNSVDGDGEKPLPPLSGVMVRSMSFENCNKANFNKTAPQPQLRARQPQRKSLQSRNSLQLTLGSKKGGNLLPI